MVFTLILILGAMNNLFHKNSSHIKPIVIAVHCGHSTCVKSPPSEFSTGSEKLTAWNSRLEFTGRLQSA